jgi:hypothetical protein
MEAQIALAMVVLLVILLAGRSVSRWLARQRVKRRIRRSQRGERAAESLLRERGYTICGRQVERHWKLRTSRGRLDVVLRPDLLVSRHWRTFVAEVKTGSCATSLTNQATRRQLLEYWCAFPVDGALLVDPEADEVIEVVFPRRSSPALSWAHALGRAALILVVALSLSTWRACGF